MRLFVWCAVVTVVLMCSTALYAAEASLPVEPASRPPSTTPMPPGQVPSPVAPAKPEAVPPTESAGATAALPAGFVEVKGDTVKTTMEDGQPLLSIADGNVTVHYKDVVATADHARVDHAAELAEFAGSVVLRMGAQEARGSRINYNMRTREWSGTDAIATILPESAKGFLSAPLFAEAKRISGQGNREVHAFDSDTTTCSLDHPHYNFTSRSMALYPNDKVVFRDVSMYVLGHKRLSMSRLVIPIKDIQKNSSILPRFGQSAEEGVFAKLAYPYLGTKSQSGLILLDLMQRKGVGKGVQHSYKFANAVGSVQLYQIFDKNINQSTLTGKATHTQRFGAIQLNASTDFRSNSYLYAPESKSMVNRIALIRDVAGANTSLSVSQNTNDSTTRTSSLAASVRHRQQFGLSTNLDTGFDYTAFDTAGQTRARLTSQVDFTSREKRFDWTISAQKLTDLSDEAFVGQGQFAGVEKLPELGLVTDTTRLGKSLPFGIPARMKVTYGSYSELPTTVSLSRTYFEANTPVHRYKLSDTWSLGAGAGFRQYVYGDNTAQYSFDSSAELSKKLGPKSNFGLTYRLQQPKGYTPLRFDYVGKYNVANASFNFQDSEKLKVSLLTGYNFEQKAFPWQDITLRMSVQPTKGLLLYTATGYDLNQSKWRTLINQLRLRSGEDFKLDLGTRYDTINKRLATIRTVLDTKLGEKMRLQAAAGYNGFTKAFDYRSVMLTRDLHCWEASVVYTSQSGFYSNQGISFNLRVKAFPFFQDYGAGAFGQTLDTSVGQVY